MSAKQTHLGRGRSPPSRVAAGHPPPIAAGPPAHSSALKLTPSNDRLKEAQSINKSLSALGDVIAALAAKGKKKGHVPFRNSKLTFLLENALGGDSKVCVIWAVQIV